MMRVLIACERSGVVRREFRELGHDAWSCDIEPADDDSPYHIQGDVLEVLGRGWDMMIAFPPCTHLCSSGARWWKAKREDGRQQRSIEFVMKLWTCDIPRVAIENPVGILSRAEYLGKPTEITQPYYHGDKHTKKTCLWLRGLEPLGKTNDVGPGPRVVLSSGKSLPEWYNLPPGPERGRLRSKTFPGIARAMATRWGSM